VRSSFRRLAALLAMATAAGAAATSPALSAHAAPRPASAASSAAAAKAAPGNSLLTEPQAQALARKTGKPVPVTAATTDSSTLTANPNGSLTLSEQNMPVRKEVDGTWKALDATLQRDSDGSVSPAVTTSGLRLSGGGTGALVSLSSEGHTLSLTLPWRLPAPVLSGATATYANVPAPGVDLEVTADNQGGFEETLVVENATAAENPALRRFSLRASVTGGLSLREDSQGDLTADSKSGQAIFELPAASLWDSRTSASAVPAEMDPAYGRKVDLRDGQPVTSAASGPGEAARTARLAPQLSGGTLTYRPDLSVLAGRSTVYPVYIDPAAGGVRTYWGQVDSTWPSQTYPKPNPMQVGYDGWQSPTFVARSFVNESVPTILDSSATDIESATLYLTDEWAPTCNTSAGDFGVQVWRTGGVTTGTDWSNQPTWAAEEDEKSFAHGYSSSCPAASEGFNVKEGMNSAAHNSWSQITFGIKADSESDEYGWKQFSDSVTLSTTFDRPPNTPGDLKTSPVTACTAATPTTVGNGDVTLYSTITDPLGSAAGSLTASVNVTDMATSKAVSGSPFKFTGLGSGSIATVLLEEATLKALAGTAVTEFSWNVSATDGTLTSPTSSTCHFYFNPTSPGAPTVCPAAGCGTQPSYTIGTAASFDVTPDSAGATPTSYNYQLNGAAPHTATASSGDATITVTPTSGTDALTVTAIAAGGNIGQPSTVIFSASAPANAADGDLTGDGIPDLVTPGGGSTGLPVGLWLAKGEAAAGGTAGDGQIITSTADIGAEGDGIVGDYSPADFTGAQVVTGLFNDNGLQDTLAYFPSGVYAGQGAILDGNGDGTVLEDEDAANTTAIPSVTFSEPDPYSDLPEQVANAYNADPNDNAAYPDLITVSGDSANGYYLEYYQNGGIPGYWVVSDVLTNPTPDGTMDWNAWQITTMAEPSGAVDMFLYNSATHALYLWQGLTVNDTLGTASYTQYELSSAWNPGTLSELRAADITGTGPALWAITTTGATTAWIASLTGTPTITAEAAQSLLSPTHDWRLGDGTSGTATTAADTSNGTAMPLTGYSGVSWYTGDLFSPAASFNGGSGTAYMSPAATQGAFDNDGDYTVSAWVKPATLGGVVLAETGNVESCMDINIDTVTVSGVTYGRWNYRMTAADTSGTTWTAATTSDENYVKLGAWTHLTATYDASADYMRLYVNGIPAASANPSAWSGSCDKFELGRLLDADEYHGYFNGDIADVQVWSGTTLTPNEVATLSGTPGYVLFPSDGTEYTSAATSTTWQWKTACAEMNFYQGKITVKETCNGTSTVTFGPGGLSGSYLTLQSDGNLVIRNSAGAAEWASATSDNPGDVMFLQPDGNLVIYGSYGQTLWAADTQNG
jgi:hypothetical protein